MLELQDIEKFSFETSSIIGASARSISAVCHFDLQNRRAPRNAYLQGYTELLEKIAFLEQESRELSTDPILICWGVRHQIRTLSLAHPDIQLPRLGYGEPAHTAMAARACAYWYGHPLQYQLHRSIHDEVRSKGRSKTSIQLEPAAATWRSWYNLYLRVLNEIWVPDPRVIQHTTDRGEEILARYSDERPRWEILCITRPITPHEKRDIFERLERAEDPYGTGRRPQPYNYLENARLGLEVSQ